MEVYPRTEDPEAWFTDSLVRSLNGMVVFFFGGGEGAGGAECGIWCIGVGVEACTEGPD